MKRIRVALGARSYPILIGQDGYQTLGTVVREFRRHRLGIVVTNRTTRRLVARQVLRALTAAGWRLTVLEVPDTERAKSPAVALRVIRRVARVAQRDVPTLFALGGGVVGDLTGYVASAFRRGVPYVQLPTTLLAQVDSAIGGKVGLDLREGKNLVGAFYQPRAVVADVRVLRSLSPRQLTSGLAEVIKYGAIADRALWRRLESHRAAIRRGRLSELLWLVTRCAQIKARIVSRDERETRGLRTLLNFGHTVGHALEAALRYSARLTHGEAIAIGMAAAADLGVELGVTPPATRAQLVGLLQAYGLPTQAPEMPVHRIERAMAFDKKFLAGTQRWVLLRRIGQATVVRGVDVQVVRRVLGWRVGRGGAR